MSAGAVMKSPKINLIVAACENMGIGINGELPWKLRAELAYFSKMTKTTQDPNKKNIVIMGRRTWESIPDKFRPLPGRINVILSSTLKQSDQPDVIIENSFESILKLLADQHEANKFETAWVIGGASVYKAAILSGLCHRIYLTKINKRFQCDTYLDPVDETKFHLVDDPLVPQELQEENGITYQYTVYEQTQLET